MKYLLLKYKKLHAGYKIAAFALLTAVALACCIAAGRAFALKDSETVLSAVESKPGVDVLYKESVSSETLIDYDPYSEDDPDVRSADPADADIVPEPVNLTVTVDGSTISILTVDGSVGAALDSQNISVGPNDLVEGAELSDVPAKGMAVTITRIESKTRVEVTEIPYETLYVWDKEMMEGEYLTLRKGSNGKITRTYTLTYEDGVLVSEVLSNEEKVDKVDEKIAYGSRSSFSNSRGDRIDYSYSFISFATAYIPDEKWGYQTEVGERARPGVIAVDPSIIPLGTKVYVQSLDPDVGDYGYAIAWDTGGHIKGYWIDLFVEYLDLASVWGARNCKVYILEDQSVDIFALRSDYFVYMDR